MTDTRPTRAYRLYPGTLAFWKIISVGFHMWRHVGKLLRERKRKKLRRKRQKRPINLEQNVHFTRVCVKTLRTFGESGLNLIRQIGKCHGRKALDKLNNKESVWRFKWAMGFWEPPRREKTWIK